MACSTVIYQWRTGGPSPECSRIIVGSVVRCGHDHEYMPVHMAYRALRRQLCSWHLCGEIWHEGVIFDGGDDSHCPEADLVSVRRSRHRAAKRTPNRDQSSRGPYFMSGGNSSRKRNSRNAERCVARRAGADARPPQCPRIAVTAVLKRTVLLSRR